MTVVDEKASPVGATPLLGTMSAAPSQAPTQAPAGVVMVRPHHFRSNVIECADNHFMRAPQVPPADFAAAAYDEVTTMAEGLRDLGVTVHLVEDTSLETPDAVFPNNWFTTHADGTIITYPMRAPSRRLERRPDVLQWLGENYQVSRVLDWTATERAGRYLEGTGVLVLDHLDRTAYVGRSLRANSVVLQRFCRTMGYRAVTFDTLDRTGLPIYHTNVMMSVGTNVALVCFEAMPHRDEERAVRESLRASGREVIDLTMAQVEEFAGNALEVAGDQSNYLVMSARGVRSLTAAQRNTIERHVPLHPVEIPTIEHAGGSARCMLAGIHLLPATASDGVCGDRGGMNQ